MFTRALRHYEDSKRIASFDASLTDSASGGDPEGGHLQGAKPASLTEEQLAQAKQGVATMMSSQAVVALASEALQVSR